IENEDKAPIIEDLPETIDVIILDPETNPSNLIPQMVCFIETCIPYKEYTLTSETA
ncbi:21989_t:CDS:2, partial [Cetraspora pellucida]